MAWVDRLTDKEVEPLTDVQRAILIEARDSLSRWIDEHQEAIQIAGRDAQYILTKRYKNVITNGFSYSGTAYREFDPDEIDERRTHWRKEKAEHKKSRQQARMKKRLKTLLADDTSTYQQPTLTEEPDYSMGLRIISTREE